MPSMISQTTLNQHITIMTESTGFITYHEALEAIWKIVHTRTRDTKHRTAQDHFMADFDNIRRVIQATGSFGTK